MVTIPCPWCDEDDILSLAELTETRAAFTCPACGTTVALVEEPDTSLEMAA
jgi:predicted RNA-binding Zn-ribbon protein involved in translation (DUF1610 family)